MKKLAKAQMGKIVRSISKTAIKAPNKQAIKNTVGTVSGAVGLGGGAGLLGYIKGRSDAEDKIKKTKTNSIKKTGGVIRTKKK
jgi:hypothetical protein